MCEENIAEFVANKWDEIINNWRKKKIRISAEEYFENLGCIVNKDSSKLHNPAAREKIENYIQEVKVYVSPTGGGAFSAYYINIPNETNLTNFIEKSKNLDLLLSFQRI